MATRMEPDRDKVIPMQASYPRQNIVHRLALAVLCLLLLYALGYGLFRQYHVEVWERDGRSYVIFPRGGRALYYLFRPASYLDGALTGMRFHIGPHPPVPDDADDSEAAQSPGLP